MYIHIYTVPASNNLPTPERNVVLLDACKHRVHTPKLRKKHHYIPLLGVTLEMG